MRIPQTPDLDDNASYLFLRDYNMTLPLTNGLKSKTNCQYTVSLHCFTRRLSGPVIIKNSPGSKP